MRLAICSVGLVSPRSTWLSIGALTPERSARSRSERSIASRSARTRGPMWIWLSMASSSVTAVGRTLSRTLHAVSDCFLRPDVLVLAGGGMLGEAWMTGVLAGVEEAAGVD